MAGPEVAPPNVKTHLQAGHHGNLLYTAGAAVSLPFCHDDTQLSVLIKMSVQGARPTDGMSHCASLRRRLQHQSLDHELLKGSFHGLHLRVRVLAAPRGALLL